MPKKALNGQSKDIAVQGTNDCSIVSKCSMAESGYFNDKYVKSFVVKNRRRSPIINRGYYIRAMAINHMLVSFLDSFRDQSNQVISLGAGFDSTYFRLHDEGYLKNTTYVEVDFHEVLIRKLSLIQRENLISTDVPQDYCDEHEQITRNIVLNTQGYKLIGVDLTQLDLLTKSLKFICINFNVPTLFLSEVVLTYLPPPSSNGVIQWAAELFNNAMFVSYEQVYPSDPFGIFMCMHFRDIGSPLKSINEYPTLASQVERYFRMVSNGVVAASDMNYFYHYLVSCSERLRVHFIEPFDEFEEWNLKCAHYMILTSFSGLCKHIVPVIWPEFVLHKRSDLLDAGVSQTHLNRTFKKFEINKDHGHFMSIWNSTDCKLFLFDDTDSLDSVDSQNARIVSSPCVDGVATQCLPHTVKTELAAIGDGFDGCCRYGHSATKVVLGANEHVVVLGGFGLSLLNRRHGRLTEATALSFKGTSVVCHQMTCRHDSLARMCHTVCAVNENHLIIVGGRFSPLSFPSDFVISIEFANNSLDQVSYQPINTTGEAPENRWRHSTTHVIINGESHLVLFGGRTLSQQCTNDCHVLNCSNWVWRKVSLKDVIPEERHSHSSDEWMNQIVIACGLSINELVLSSIFIFNAECCIWQEFLALPPISPRYSHCSAISNNHLILVGGVSVSCLSPGIELANLKTGAVQQVSLQMPRLEHLFMFHNNVCILLDDVTGDCTRLLLVGGGGNCFSFGTHLNNYLALLTIQW